ncbi:hypothetical protein C446_15353 [Halobiforma nitratireducens JCM 10879]|uniref:Uncharacterized protein n=1 Tax=Halobiforma nitratireducens JCM 10879 TaxID=1227454 RepID=M0LHJ3_9EURY|nr:hypothetical protein C446_15353 [Halobiforma nitratireducens JCM 10879]
MSRDPAISKDLIFRLSMGFEPCSSCNLIHETFLFLGSLRCVERIRFLGVEIFGILVFNVNLNEMLISTWIDNFHTNNAVFGADDFCLHESTLLVR